MFAAVIRRNIRNLGADTEGSSAILFAIAVPAVVGFTALAADIGNAYLQEEKLKQLTETVALSAMLQVRENQVFGAGLKTEKFKPELVAFAKENMQNAAGSVAVTEKDIEFGIWDFENKVFTPSSSSKPVNAARVRGHMNRLRGNQLPSFFGKLMIDGFDISAQAVAVLPFPPDFHALSKTAGRAVVFDDSDIDTYRFVINSNASDALSLPGSSSTQFGTWTVTVGGDIAGSLAGRRQAKGSVETRKAGLADFLENQPSPSVVGCNYVDAELRPNLHRIVVTPGTYCGGLKLEVAANEIVFKPGVYVFKDGPLKITGQKQVVGDRVFLFFTGKRSGLDVSDSHVSLRAKRNGKWAGITVMSDRRKRFAPDSHNVERTVFASIGTVYTPASQLVMNNVILHVTCRGVCVAADTMQYRQTKINGYNRMQIPKRLRLPGSNQAVAPVGLNASFRPYLIEQVAAVGQHGG